ncbi:MAG: hypothetical protein LC620_03520, partial [Halobacteriales archaeon]|nr:hypothetical protein [Halobacteriales archaeon]
VMGLMALGIGFRYLLDILAAVAGNAGPLGGWILFLFLAYTGVTLAFWMYWGWRVHRARDPWAYDPELDGPDPRVRRGLEDAEQRK